MRSLRRAPQYANRKTQWCRRFDAKLTELVPEATGRIDWEAIMHLFYKGMTPEAAAEQHAQHFQPRHEWTDTHSGATVGAD